MFPDADAARVAGDLPEARRRKKIGVRGRLPCQGEVGRLIAGRRKELNKRDRELAAEAAEDGGLE